LRMVGLAWDISLPKLGRAKEINSATAPESPTVLAPPAPEVLPQEAMGD
jgi:hypothetical protein